MIIDKIVMLTKAEEVADVARYMAERNAPQAPLYQAAARGEIALLSMLYPKMAWPAERLADRTRPTVLLIGDDPDTRQGLTAVGPKGWRCTSRISRWAAVVLVHASGGTPLEYRVAALNARVALRVAVIETSTAYADAWARAIGCPKTLTIRPENGPHSIDNRVLH